MNEINTKHLDYIQDVIARMNHNSFQLKGWMIAVVSALIALSVSTDERTILLIAVASTIVFWIVDAVYLQNERCYIALYNDVAELTDCNFRRLVRPFDMDISEYKRSGDNLFKTLISRTLLLFYMPIGVLLFIGFLLLGGGF